VFNLVGFKGRLCGSWQSRSGLEIDAGSDGYGYSIVDIPKADIFLERDQKSIDGSAREDIFMDLFISPLSHLMDVNTINAHPILPNGSPCTYRTLLLLERKGEKIG
jgi:hypothetical protein